MDRTDLHSESEDEAFQSADEGDDIHDNRGPNANAGVDKAALIVEEQQGGGEDNLENEKKLVGSNGNEELSRIDNPAENPVIESGTEKAAEEMEHDDPPLQGHSPIACDDNSDPVDKSNDIAKDDLNASSKLELSDNSDSPIAQAMDRLAISNDQPKSSTEESSSSTSGGWGWGGWGNVISKATTSVSSMLETVETQLGIPNPVEMAAIVTRNEAREQPDHKEGEAQQQPLIPKQDAPASNVADDVPECSAESTDKHEPGLGSWFSNLGVSKISSMVQNTGKELVSGSLDALEFVGKKTMDVIAKSDPGFRDKGTTLSQALREAKERAASGEGDNYNEGNDDTVIFSVEFDKFQGLAHLEALEMISRESKAELEKILLASSEESKTDHETLFADIKEKFQEPNDVEDADDNEDLENFVEVINELVSNLSLNITASKLVASYTSTYDASVGKGTGEEVRKSNELFADAVTGFAQMTAHSVEIFHKIGELMLLPDIKASFLVKNRAESTQRICKILKAYLSSLSSRYAAILNDLSGENSNDETISKFITDVYLEASNSSSYIEDSYHLLLPIFQLSAAR
eukprot:gene7326-8144_t